MSNTDKTIPLKEQAEHLYNILKRGNCVNETFKDYMINEFEIHFGVVTKNYICEIESLNKTIKSLEGDIIKLSDRLERRT